MVLGILIGFLSALVVFTIIIANADSIPVIQIVQATGSISIAISAFVAIHLYLATIKRHRDEDARKASTEYLREAILLLERAYEAFSDIGGSSGAPRNDRLLWLTVARTFLRYYRMRDKITQEEQKEIVNEHEEHWRHQIYVLLSDNIRRFDLDYFMESGSIHAGNNIQPDSLVVIFDFARWYEDTEDPLPEADVVAMFKKGAIPPDYDGALEYLELFPKYSPTENKTDEGSY